jgi:uncharacterized protein
MAKVYFYRIKKQSPQVLYRAGKEIFKVFSGFFGKKDKLAIKVHFGERKSNTYLGPDFTRAIFEELKNKVKKTALVDCTVLYKGERSFASSHKKLAKDHGFSFAPIEILDGENGTEETKIRINKKHFKFARIGVGIKNFNAVLAISHFKGHGASAFGGAIKNIGMGLGSKGGKMAMHQAFKISVNNELCLGCGLCCLKCPGKAISLENKKAKIDYKKCLGCGLCISVCPQKAIQIPWGSGSSQELQERMAEYTLAVLKGRKAFFINALINITPGCDCMDVLQKPIMKDIGILASEDIVALEKASLDLAGKENFRNRGNNPEIQINYAQKLGLGKKKYKLIKLN